MKKPQFTLRGVIPTVWSGNGAAEAIGPFRRLHARARFPVVQIHAWPSSATELSIRSIREVVPDAKIIFGVGMDNVISRAVAAGMSRGVRTATEEYVQLARRAVGQGAVALMFDEEAAAKAADGSDRDKIVEETLRSAHLAVSAAFPDLPLLHTTYDHPTYHASYPWKVVLGPESPICAEAFQVYAAPGEDVSAHRGALPRREASAFSSYSTAVRKGWITPDAPEGSEADLSDVDWLAYYQLHHVALADTARHMAEKKVSFGWAYPSRTDADGELALLTAHALHLLGFGGSPTAVTDFQARYGLKVDNVVGPETSARALREAGIR